MSKDKIKIFDLFDEEAKKWSVSTKNAHIKEALNMWHGALRIILLDKSKKEPTILLQKRSKAKRHNKGLFDLSFATHLYEYPSLKDTLIERLPKEVGLTHKDISNLVNAGKCLDLSIVKVKNREHCDREVVHTLWGQFDKNLDELVWDKKEVHSVWLISVSDFWKILDGQNIEIEGFDGDDHIKQTVSIKDFAVRFDKFYEKILIMSERYHKGETIAI